MWVQCTISRVDDLFAEEQVGGLMTNAPTFTSGRNICEFPIELEPGTYKVRIYVRERNEGAVRIEYGSISGSGMKELYGLRRSLKILR